MIKYLVVIVLLLTSFVASAAPNYSYCEIAGFALGYNKEFIGSVAARIVNKQGILNDLECRADWSKAYKRGKKLLNKDGDEWTQFDLATWQKMQDFEEKVNDSIIKNLSL